MSAKNLRTFRGKSPVVPESCFIDPTAVLIGDVVLGEDASVWINSVLRGDVNAIRIGARTNIQDLTMVHVYHHTWDTRLGDDVTVGHHVMLHGCHIGNRVLVGMGAVVMDGVEVGDDCIIGAGTLLPPGTKVPAGSLVVGSPGKVKRPLTPEERASLVKSSQNYVGFAREHRASLNER